MPSLYGAHQVFNRQLAAAGQAETLARVDRSRMSFGHRLTVTTDKGILIGFDASGELTPDDALELQAGESYSEDGVIFSSLRFVNLVTGETPRVRGIIWGN
jgi:hypothetical protein